MLLCACFLWVGFSQLNPEGAMTVEIIRFGATPNYPLCSDTADRIQISDNRTERYPMWTRKGCVGWRQQGIVTIEGRVPQHPNKTLRGYFRIHVGAGEHANVFPPARIDVYAANAHGNFLHVAEQARKPDTADRRDHWIDIPAHLPSRRFVLIIRPQGSYLFIDEIQWVTSANVPLTGPTEEIGNIEALAEDAAKRHRAALERAAAQKAKKRNKWLANTDKARLILWPVENPFGIIDGTIPRPTNDKVKTVSRRHGSAAEKENLCFGIAFSGGKTRKCVLQLQGNTAVKDGIELGILSPVLAADGSMVYDPIMPLARGSSLHLLPNRPAYIWMTVDFSRLPAGTHRVDLLVKTLNGHTLGALPVSLTALPWRPADGHKPFAVNWGYLSSRPICKQPEKCLQDMTAHGINVFVIHPARIPPPGKRDAQFIKKAALLKKDVILLRGSGRKLLLYLRWDKRLPNESETKQWVRWAKSQMADFGLKPSDWALYPVDEAHGRKFGLLKKYAEWIKAADPTVQIYANPIATRSESVSYSDLRDIEKQIDIWQPSIKFVKNQDGRFFNAERASWWVYQNPPSPAKTASPLRHYRLIAWSAWLVDAKGVGFWAYGDTTGSSAWDDFDGRRPDYAVVYEHDNGPISSRRWEAFRDGVEDYQLFSAACERNPELRKTLKLKIEDIFTHDNNIHQKMDKVRQIALMRD